MADQDVFPAHARNEFIMAQFLHEKINQEVQYKRKNMSKVNNQTLKELKYAIELINENITEMRKTIKENHKEVMTKIEQVERKTEIALELAKKNEIEINNISKDYNEFRKECNPNHLNNLTERIKNLKHSSRTRTKAIKQIE